MNPLTFEARRDRKAESRADTILAIECGVAFAVLILLFLL